MNKRKKKEFRGEKGKKVENEKLGEVSVGRTKNSRGKLVLLWQFRRATKDVVFSNILKMSLWSSL